ncbi:hypothetical protein [Burkholderia cenocepacia]|uniref:hypothetical protein n=1 Tax=Burkholderia cenocepacia TaxID=95486 RepID=UPI001CF5EE4C|nr:hypothetical protein [Burkholderia cenocepacia]MCA8233622.1 hypothetical protein [Burkholderia cenocepacia]
MHSTLAFAIGNAVVLILASIGVVLFLKRHSISPPIDTPPAAAAVASPVQYELIDPTLDEWEAQAPTLTMRCVQSDMHRRHPP